MVMVESWMMHELSMRRIHVDVNEDEDDEQSSVYAEVAGSRPHQNENERRMDGVITVREHA